MSADLKVHHGITVTTGPEWSYKLKAGDPKAYASITYEDAEEGWETRVPIEGSAHPVIPGLLLTEINASGKEGGLAKVVLAYESAEWVSGPPGRNPAETSTERFLLRPSLSDEPLLTHPKFETLTTEAQTALVTYANSQRTEADYSAALEVITDPETEGKFLTALRKGQEAWRAPRTIWQRKSALRNLSGLDLALIGKSVAEPPKDPDGQPTTPPGRNWMYLAPDIAQTQDGLGYEVTEYWELSDEGGWEDYFYLPEEE